MPSFAQGLLGRRGRRCLLRAGRGGLGQRSQPAEEPRAFADGGVSDILKVLGCACAAAVRGCQAPRTVRPFLNKPGAGQRGQITLRCLPRDARDIGDAPGIDRAAGRHLIRIVVRHRPRRSFPEFPPRGIKRRMSEDAEHHDRIQVSDALPAEDEVIEQHRRPGVLLLDQAVRRGLANSVFRLASRRRRRCRRPSRLGGFASHRFSLSAPPATRNLRRDSARRRGCHPPRPCQGSDARA